MSDSITDTMAAMVKTHENRSAGRRIIIAARRKARITQRELSAKCGVHSATIARIEAGIVASPKLETVLRILAGIGYTLELAETKNGGTEIE